MSLLKYSAARNIEAAERTKKEVTTTPNRAVLFLRNKRIIEMSNGNTIKNKGVDIGCIYWKMFNSVGIKEWGVLRYVLWPENVFFCLFSRNLLKQTGSMVAFL
ncbi:MAG: hypothetical protein JW915_15560 [Chitinispirillaceae bacterium]|nr:hypothetical protein [Chitinispirillaceae bacterium]